MDNSNKKCLVVGAGSIGRRHMKNLLSLGVGSLVACDVDPGRLEPAVQELGVQSFTDYDTALEQSNPDIVFICTPPSMHVSQAIQAVSSGAHVFVEKPLSASREGLDQLVVEARNAERLVQVGYNLRYHPGIRRTRELIREGAIGKVLWAYVEFGQYLPDWRPWQDYRQSYTARKELGGGIVLDSTHEIDYTIWMLGRPTELVCMANKLSALEMDVEDTADIVLRFASGTEATIHLDCIQRSYSRFCRLAGEQGSIHWDYALNLIRLFDVGSGKWEEIPYEFDPNQMYLDEVRAFLETIEHPEQTGENLAQSILVLETAWAALESSAKNKWIKMDK